MMSILDGLMDDKNLALLRKLEKVHIIKIEVVNNTSEYRCCSRKSNSTIYVPKSDICADSFTHELLHIYLRFKEIFVGANLKSSIRGVEGLSKIYSDGLLEHIGNCLDHLMMLPIYLELGCDRSKFIIDYHKNKCTNHELEKIKRNWKKRFTYNSKMIDFYLGKYFAIKACPNLDFDYSDSLEGLSKIDKRLFLINEKLVNNWLQVDIDSQNIEDGFRTIVRNYVYDMESWIKLKRIR